MSKHDEARRAFLIGAAVGAAAVAGAVLVPEAVAQTHEQHQAKDSPATTAQSHAQGSGHGAFLNDDDAATVAAFAERLMPGAPGKPGAREAGVLNYIDLALSGAYEDLQDFYRRGLASLDTHCRKTYNAPFVKLDAARQDEVIMALEQKPKGTLLGRVMTEAMPNGATPKAFAGSVKSQPSANGLRTVLMFQRVGTQRYFDTAGFPGRTLGLDAETGKQKTAGK